MSRRSLTARGVKQMLTRRGIDWRNLSITEQTTTARRIDIGYIGPWETFTEVKIAGPRSIRNPACFALFCAGLSEAGYPEYSLFSRKG